jgi:hypothetical protein
MTSIISCPAHGSVASVAAGESPPPCFFWPACCERAALEKAGRSVCRRCAAILRGAEYPLRDPCAEPQYFTGRTAAEALDMLDDQPRPVREDHKFISGYRPSPGPDFEPIPT